MTRSPVAGAPAAGPSAGAACAADPELMFPLQESELPGQPTDAERRAQLLCRRCPVLVACRAQALDTLESMPLESGVVGGMSVADRRFARARHRGLLASPPLPLLADSSATPPPLQRPSARSAAATSDVAAVPDVADGRGSRREGPPEPAPRWVRAGTAAHAEVPNQLAELVRRTAGDYPAVVAVVDTAVICGLVYDTDGGPASASRWEVALAAVTLLERGTSMAAVMRQLGEPAREVRAWRDRRRARVDLVPGGAGVGHQRVPRPPRELGGAA